MAGWMGVVVVCVTDLLTHTYITGIALVIGHPGQPEKYMMV